MGLELFNADRQTDRHEDLMKLIASFRNFMNPPKTAELNKFRRRNDLHCVQGTVYSVQCTMYSVRCTMYVSSVIYSIFTQYAT